MVWREKHFLKHPQPGAAGELPEQHTGGSRKYLKMCTLLIWLRFYHHCFTKTMKGLLFRFGCHLFSSWHHIENDCICTTGNVLKINSIYAYKEGDNVDLVRLTNVHIERRYLYCSLFFFSMNKIITVRQTMLKGAPIHWSLSDNKEYDELMSFALWNESNKGQELLEFDFLSH
ncbi:MAG: hypothetical protein ACM3RX_00495 [Methanococcaceae archaeon]